jgi:hypothetical protein
MKAIWKKAVCCRGCRDASRHDGGIVAIRCKMLRHSRWDCNYTKQDASPFDGEIVAVKN